MKGVHTQEHTHTHQVFALLILLGFPPGRRGFAPRQKSEVPQGPAGPGIQMSPGLYFPATGKMLGTKNPKSIAHQRAYQDNSSRWVFENVLFLAGISC